MKNQSIICVLSLPQVISFILQIHENQHQTSEDFSFEKS